jgi:hypothetical protein
MEAERIILETDDHGRVKNLPPLPPMSRIEAIFLIPESHPGKVLRTPHPLLAEITEIRGDIMAPAVPEEDWLSESCGFGTGEIRDK